MENKEKNEIISYLKDTILQKGALYLQENAFEVYEGLETEQRIRVAVLSCLLNGISEFSLKDNVQYEDMFKYIQANCLLNEETTTYMTNIFLEVFSSDSKKEYDTNKEKGFEEFCNKEHEIYVECWTCWYIQAVHVNCSFNANICFKIADKEKVRKDNLDLIQKNPYLTCDYFYEKYKEEMTEKLEEDFKEYCHSDDYYEPCCEDYISNGECLIESYCAKHGLELVSFEGDGETSDYEM